ncbi:MAG TPA: REDY-like protein HapK [Alphaproteobacteria bacterium]
MAIMVVLFNLKPGVAPEEYERWARESDVPAVNALESVERFRVYRSLGLLGSDAKPPYAYMELVEIADLDKLAEDAATEKMQEITRQFQAMADNPVWILLDQFA